jgi:hypothetical protein
MRPKLSLKFTATAVALLMTTAPVIAVVVGSSLMGVAEVPPNDSDGTGSVSADFDPETKLLTWTISYENLSGPATAAHFHGPANPDENAPPVVPIEGDLTSPISGEITLTDEQAAELQAGRWYFNIHTDKYPGGELRGQLPIFGD